MVPLPSFRQVVVLLAACAGAALTRDRGTTDEDAIPPVHWHAPGSALDTAFRGLPVTPAVFVDSAPRLTDSRDSLENARRGRLRSALVLGYDVDQVAHDSDQYSGAAYWRVTLEPVACAHGVDFGIVSFVATRNYGGGRKFSIRSVISETEPVLRTQFFVDPKPMSFRGTESTVMSTTMDSLIAANELRVRLESARQQCDGMLTDGDRRAMRRVLEGF